MTESSYVSTGRQGLDSAIIISRMNKESDTPSMKGVCNVRGRIGAV